MTQEPENLDAFEAQLRRLQPRAARYPAPLLVQSQAQLATGDAVLAGRHRVRPTFYRTVGISAACGALAGGLIGAACSWLLLQRPPADFPSQSPVLVESIVAGDVATVASSPPRSPHTPTYSRAEADPPPVWEESSPSLLSWVNDPYALGPGTLSVGSRFVSRSSSPSEPVLDPRLAAFDPAADALSEVSSPPYESAPLLPQRQWMRLMLSSPEHLF